MKLSVILPARNEEELIKKTVEQIYKYLKRRKYTSEILVVINGSVDSTEETVKLLSRRYYQIKVLNSKPGYGFALRKGMKHAKGDYVSVFNVDFYDFKLLHFMDKGWEGKDIVIGSKLAPGSIDNRPFLRRLVSLLFNYYLKIVYGFRGTDTHGIKIMRRRVIKNVLPKCKTSSGIFDTEFIIKAQREGFNIIDFPVSVREKRPSRFVRRFLQTPKDIFSLYKSLK
jgi:glycosyltransferase involved in cell wall biosynthesis